MWDLIISTFDTGNGFWNPLVWGVIILISLLIAYVIRSFGNTKYKTGTEQTKVFLSGNPEFEKEEMHVKSSNLYWGFMEALKGVYQVLLKIHTGNISDYVLWFVIVMGLAFILFVGVF